MSESHQQLRDKKLAIIDEARAVLNGKDRDPRELKSLYQQLEQMDQFAYATDILLTKMQIDQQKGQPTSPKEFQTLAKFIYKDHSLPSSFKFTRAIKELNGRDDLEKTTKCETLGLAGAIYKRIWQFDHQFKNLILSRYYYKKGYDLWKHYLEQKLITEESDQNDKGYTAINYAYINELMAVDKLEEHGNITGVSESILERIREAEDVRKYILSKLIISVDNEPRMMPAIADKWLPATVAEAYFGLRQYDLALKFVNEYVCLHKKGLKTSSDNKDETESQEMLAWEIRSFTQQLFSIAYLQLFQKNFFPQNHNPASEREQKLCEIADDIDTAKINACLHALVTVTDNSETALTEIKKDGKLGLALSGGGFRASLFHVGVLASLAESDKLRDIEVISCVSGGSIIGAYYYVKLKKLLEAKTDLEIVKDDYVKLVKEIETEFLKGVQQNLRVQVLTNLACNFRMLFSKGYSRTHRLGELYEKYFYGPLLPDLKRPIYMNDLFINPKLAEGETFDMGVDNWKRKNKVPQLVLNATSVNTGHNWQFTASWMGEPPGNILTDIDVKPRLRRMYYKDAPDNYKEFRLGYAVGASSCVPVMFHPMPMHDLYEDIDLQLVDGGVHDNQGIAALLEQECRNMIISDASGQMPTNKIATNNTISIFYRSDSILQERLRELQFMDIKQRNYTTQINQLLKVHLKNDLQSNPKNWKDCPEPPRKITAVASDNETQLTKYGVLRSIQSRLSEIRTDLDSFHDLEAYALMYSGYVQANHECRTTEGVESNQWNFMKVKSSLTNLAQSRNVEKTLAVSKDQMLKVIKLNTTIKVLTICFLGLVICGLIYACVKFWNESLLDITVKYLAFVVFIFLIGRLSEIIAAMINYKTTIRKTIFTAVLAVTGFLVSNFYMWIMNPIYNRSGKIK